MMNLAGLIWQGWLSTCSGQSTARSQCNDIYSRGSWPLGFDSDFRAGDWNQNLFPVTSLLYPSQGLGWNRAFLCFSTKAFIPLNFFFFVLFLPPGIFFLCSCMSHLYFETFFPPVRTNLFMFFSRHLSSTDIMVIFDCVLSFLLSCKFGEDIGHALINLVCFSYHFGKHLLLDT